MTQSILSHEFDNGLVLLAEPMDSVESAAFSMLLPAGAAFDPTDRGGLATLTCEMVLRGCGSRDSRQFITDLENLGVQRGESVASAHVNLGVRPLPRICRPRCGFMPTCCGGRIYQKISSTPAG